jgi:hypothetical protein
VAAGMRRGTIVRVWLLPFLTMVLALSGASAVRAATTTTITTPPSAVSPVDPKEYVQGCFACHGREGMATVDAEGIAKSLYLDPAAYQGSVHGIQACNSCHIGFSHDPHAPVSNVAAFAQIAREACRNCHANQFAMFERSYHGTLTKGQSAQGLNAPDCVDCHGAHDVKAVNSPGYRGAIADICGRCHGGREKTYLDTYHGKAVSLGREAAATCTDCHGNHSILPQSDPDSTLSSAKILATCQRCHPSATQNFTTFRVHITATSPSAPSVVFWVSLFYIVLIAGVFTFGGVHTILYVYRGLKDGSYFRKKGGH